MGAESTNLAPCHGCAERDRRIAELEARLAEQEARLAEQEARLAEQEARLAEQEARVAALGAELEQALRSGRRQAAPFSKGPPEADPKRPGRKPGDGYGTRARRPIPPRVDEVHEARLPASCPACGGPVTPTPTPTAHQYQLEIPRTPVHRRFDVRVGRCSCCRRRVPPLGRHPPQAGDALGAAASQLGPDAQAAAVHLNKRAGLSHGKVAAFFGDLFGVGLSRGGSCHAVLRAGRRCEGNYDAVVGHVRGSNRAVPDETGWRVGGPGAWLHAAATDLAVAYLIHRRRGFDAAAELLGEGYAGQMTRDGWAPCKRFRHATHPLCLAHLLRRCREVLATATRGAAVFPRRVKALLQEALAARDERDAGGLPPGRAAAQADDLGGRMYALLRPIKAHRANEPFARHLWANRSHLFTFLRHPGLDATNWRAEHAPRPAVVNRKVRGGNRTWAGAHAQSVLMSVLQTARLRGTDSMHSLSRLLCAPAGREPLLIPT